MPKLPIRKLFSQPLLPKTITKESTARTEGNTKGMRENAFTALLNGKSLFASRNAAGIPIISEKNTDTNACEKEFQSRPLFPAMTEAMLAIFPWERMHATAIIDKGYAKKNSRNSMGM